MNKYTADFETATWLDDDETNNAQSLATAVSGDDGLVTFAGLEYGEDAKDTEELIYPEAKSIPQPADFYEAVLLLFADKNINSYIEKNVQQDVSSITNPFIFLLSLSILISLI